MEMKTLAAKTRATGTKGATHQSRRDGEIPGVLYGGGKGPVSLAVDGREFDRLVHAEGVHAIVKLAFSDGSGNDSPAMLKAVQRHNLRYNVTHADFVRISLDEKIQTMVPIEFTGRCHGVTEGGLLEHQLREVEVECLALDVPAALHLDITDLGIGQSYHVSQIAVPAGVTILNDGADPVVSVHMPRISSSETAQESEDAGAEAGKTEAKAD